MQDVVFGPLPPLLTFINKDDVFADLHHGVHVVRVDDCRDVVLLRDLMDQVVDQHRGHRIESRVGLVTKQVFGVQYDGPCDSDPFDHSSTKFSRVEMVYVSQIDPFEAKVDPIPLFVHRHIGEEVQRQSDVLLYVRRIEQGSALKEHAHLFANRFQLGERERVETNIVVVDVSAIDLVQADKRFQQDGFTRTALSDDQVGDARRELGGDVV